MTRVTDDALRLPVQMLLGEAGSAARTPGAAQGAATKRAKAGQACTRKAGCARRGDRRASVRRTARGGTLPQALGTRLTWCHMPFAQNCRPLRRSCAHTQGMVMNLTHGRNTCLPFLRPRARTLDKTHLQMSYSPILTPTASTWRQHRGSQIEQGRCSQRDAHVPHDRNATQAGQRPGCLWFGNRARAERQNRAGMHQRAIQS